MRTFRYSRQCPEGKIFDTEPNRPDPYPPPTESQGWYDNPGALKMTTDQLIESVVKAELANQAKDKYKLEREYTDKTGDIPHFAAKEKTLISVLDDSHARERKRR